MSIGYKSLPLFECQTNPKSPGTGHCFGQRVTKKYTDQSVAAAFVQFLNCTWQIWDQVRRTYCSLLLFLRIALLLPSDAMAQRNSCGSAVATNPFTKIHTP